MKLILTSIFFLSTQLSFGISNDLNDYYLNGKRLVWQGKKDKNHYYYDFDGDQKIDAFDSVLENGVDYYSGRLNGVYQNKVSIRKSGNGFTEKQLIKDLDDWKEISSKFLSLLPDQDISSRTIASEKLCYEIDKVTFKNVYDRAVKCFVDPKKGGNFGTQIIQKMTSALRGNTLGHTTLTVSDSKESGIRQFKCGPNDQTFNCVEKVADLINIQSNNQELVEKAVFHNLLHLAGFHHVMSKVDLVYVCSECCMKNNEAACNFCSNTNSFKLADGSFEYYLLSLFIYDDYLNDEDHFQQYHVALENVYSQLEKHDVLKVLSNNVSWSKDEIIEKLFIQFTKHIGNKVNSRGKAKLYYSDLISEIMAKIACHEESNQIVVNLEKIRNCEVMYLARSIPESFCFSEIDKLSCKQKYRDEYSLRKEEHAKGIRIPSNFKGLN